MNVLNLKKSLLGAFFILDFLIFTLQKLKDFQIKLYSVQFKFFTAFRLDIHRATQNVRK